MVEELCGLEIQTNFDNVGCKLDEHFSIDDVCSSEDEYSDSDGWRSNVALRYKQTLTMWNVN